MSPRIPHSRSPSEEPQQSGVQADSPPPSCLGGVADPGTASRWITQASGQERAAQAELEAVLRTAPPPLTVDDVEAAVTELGGLVAILADADPGDRAELYEALGVGAQYDAATRTAVLEAQPTWGQARVGGTSAPERTRALRHRRDAAAAGNVLAGSSLTAPPLGVSRMPLCRQLIWTRTRFVSSSGSSPTRPAGSSASRS
jgi:hypothetical protein